MAISPSHQFGQIIGDAVEAAVIPLLERFAKEYRLYLDKQGDRPCRSGKKCSWVDLNGNSHDLDFVLERGGTRSRRGMPVAFIETAWRRYTKHSRNKVQEIQGAIMPLVETYRNSAPFPGVILAGVFTGAALTQLRSLGFTILLFPYETIVAVFRKFGIDAAFDESTSVAAFQKKIAAYKALSTAKGKRLQAELMRANAESVKEFIASLAIAASRQIERIIVLPLHGLGHEVTTIGEAIEFIENYCEAANVDNFDRYEIQVRYNNGNKIDATFGNKDGAIEFLRIYQPVPLD